ncbi:MAG: RsmD family RNA methyltransferase [Candidatus Amulumruptor caecigallinarius]|nr:RsmD family RNA methyltransferase [Candidatus Amulumruptor caecigallinarius]MCM1397658.1 RsmD family RNA methyltransferase [Candidatus Amulumruptor caecigallinarius]MCM1454662.1 RsmD family RNA methyltransferase [bacterium]
MRIIRGKFGRRRFPVPTRITARPTTDFARENIFNVIENLVDIEGITAADLFAGTGAITFELISRGARMVTAVEKAPVQSRFIADVAAKLGCEEELQLVTGDVFRFIATAREQRDLVFCDPPYDHPRFAEIPSLVLGSALVGPGTTFIMEHSARHDFSTLPGFSEHRAYGSVNFSIFRL